MTRGVVLVAAALVALAIVAVWHPARVAVLTLALLPALFPSAPFDALSLVTAAPTHDRHQYAYAAGTVDADMFHPTDGGRHGAIVLLLGVGDLPHSDLAVHFAEGLARLGVVALLPDISGLRAERLTFDEVDALRLSVELLRSQPDVDPGRVGLVGLSAAGGLSIVAAGQPSLRDQVRFVNSFGSYDDATRLLLDVASHSIDVDGQVHPWQPEERTREVISIALNETLTDPTDRELLAELVAGTTRERARDDIARLPGAARDRLQAISPSNYLSQVRAHLYLMHDVDDSFIPYTQSRDLVAHAPPDAVWRHTEFSIFAHVIPDRPVPWHIFLPDLWRLFWHVHAVLLELL